MSVLLALCTMPNDEAAARLARSLVDEPLAVCVKRLPGLGLTYRWQGEVHEDNEVLLLIMTTHEALARIKQRLPALHPHDAPELLGFEAVDGLAAYLA